MKRKTQRLLMALLLLSLLTLITGSALYNLLKQSDTTPYYLAADRPEITLYDEDGESFVFARGTQVDIQSRRVKKDDGEYCRFLYDERRFLVSESDLASDRHDCVKEEKIYALRDHVLYREPGDYHIVDWILKGSELQVSGFHELDEQGRVDYYYVNERGYIDAEHTAFAYYETALDASIYADVFYGEGGDPTRIDYYPKEYTPVNMPDKVIALYLNAESIVDADIYLDIAEGTRINSFVVDIKDCYVDTQLAYDSPIAREYEPSVENIPNSFDTYQNNVKKLKDAGYYVIGRITAFKDDAFAADNPEEALLYNDALYTYGSVKWPSIYSRRMWEYNVALALEAAEQMGFDEIQFDYVRLPEDVEGVDLRNTYDEGRAQAITAFLRYAAECLHQKNISISADVFGEISGAYEDEFSAFVSYYGQFWPAISNAVDAISSMPYADHFAAYSFGIPDPWAQPGELMRAWAKTAASAQAKTYDPALCRTWIMAQNSGPYDVTYTDHMIAEQIEGLSAAGVNDGYMTWNASSDPYKYGLYAPVME